MPIIKTYTSNEEAYRELKNVEYLQSSGTQYIDTNYAYNQNYDNGKIKIKYTPTEISGTYHALRVSGAYDGSRSMIMYGCTNDGRVGAGGGDYQINYSFQANQLYEVDITAKSGIISGTINSQTISSNYSGQNKCSKPYFIFCNDENGTASMYGKIKLYYFQMYDNDILVRDYQPVVMNDVGYLYDKVEHKLYGNDGTGSFTYGSILDIEINPQDSGWVDRYYDDGKLNLLATPNEGYEFVNWLLKGYTRLGYIESTGTQWINTLLNLNQFNNVRVFANLEFVSFTNTWQWICGTQNSATSNNGAFGFGGNGSHNWTYVLPGHNESTNVPIILNTDYEVEMYFQSGQQHLKVDGQTLLSHTYTGILSTNNLAIFGSNSNSGVQQFSNIKLKSLSIYCDNLLVRDYISVIQHSTGQIGLLDLVELKFYGNSGTGEFIGGNIV